MREPEEVLLEPAVPFLPALCFDLNCSGADWEGCFHLGLTWVPEIGDFYELQHNTQINYI